MEMANARTSINRINNFDILQTIGTGQYTRVRLAKDKKNSEYYAIKMFKKGDIIKNKKIDNVLSELSVIQSINFPFIVKFMGLSQDDRYLYFILEYIQGGEFFSFLRNKDKLENSEVLFYGAQIVLTLEYLHGKNIIYRDVKPENLLINTDGFLKMTDFGFAKFCDYRTHTLCGTPEYIAPEIILNKKEGHGKPADWWSFGVLIYEMLLGIDPFHDEDPVQIYFKILKGKIKFPTKNFDKNAKSLIKHLLVQDPLKRFGSQKGGVNDIKTHRFFADIDWDALLLKKVPVPFKPTIKFKGDSSNFQTYPDSSEQPKQLKPADDIFLNW